MSYQYDVFVSYRRKAPVEGWVQEVFVPALRKWLPGAANIAGERLYLDVAPESTPVGSHWPTRLKQALDGSACLLPVLSPEYFQSYWCQVELATILARRVSGNPGNPSLLVTPEVPGAIDSPFIFPVRFSDGEFFPPHIQGLQQYDMGRFNHLDKLPKSHKSFTRAIQDIARQIGKKVQEMPPWEPSDPGEVPPPRTPPLTRQGF